VKHLTIVRHAKSSWKHPGLADRDRPLNKRGCSPGDIQVDERIYGAGVAGLIGLVQEVDDSVERVMLFGHNPELTGLVNRLARISLDNLPTCGVVHLEFALDTWAGLGTELALRTDVDYPKKTS
jgi:phosphohistidine phosphatase